MGGGIAAQKSSGDLSHQRRPLRGGSLIVVVSLLASLLLRPALAFEGKPKFGPNAAPILEQTAYLRTAVAPDYWKLNPFYVSQTTSSDCSVASITMAINFMLGLPAGSEEPIVTQSLLLEKIADAGWAKDVANGGGVSFAEFVSMVSESLATFQLQDQFVETIRPTDDTPETLASLRQVLAINEASDQDIVLVYFNQGVLTGDWDGPHISPIAAYDQESRQVLIMDVDREWYVPIGLRTPNCSRRCSGRLRPRMAGLQGRRALSSGSRLHHRNESGKNAMMHQGRGWR